MPFPNFKNKYKQKALFTPHDYLSYVKRIEKSPKDRPPESVIFCYGGGLLDYVIRNHNVKRTAEELYGHFYLLSETKNKVGIVGRFGIGAPAVIPFLEEFIAWGVKKFVTVGEAGSLQKHLHPGDIVVCDRAIRDEGTSYHYMKPSKYAYASKTLTKKLETSLDSLGHTYNRGTSWTIDAVYRETIAEVIKYQKEGVATVEMEAAALFTVAQYRKVQMGAMFTISDSLAGLQWSPQFHHEKTKAGKETLYKAAVKALSSR
ncbi:MAG TPA: nucleoside phosphorylase [Candidatus Kapabacteria bacterium]|nr:nucleoside phosphorylase [Candidatus Kapabacteria bacterium]